ncbi:phosphonate C-P lyase system protein PhnH [Alkalimarinus alittae]|uniref:Phosphonate C-P lyase system protein PhnH n=1 Tax=Alkalimarinus alittae TaxID=2961619 RepID=A0ABY6N2D4_9ALTE|nr:phosphonate C-P lyase system protein PhnH [Alkalimarinus alittae]UZE96243.1 phosphonate C-P lyase system protein PhnH [Alkalimarinus alittae]
MQSSIAPESHGAINTQGLWHGFQNEVIDAQHCFRKIMKAMSEPGFLVTLEPLNTTGNISSATFSVALTLIDQDISVWVSPQLSSREFIDNLRFYCGCRLTSSPLDADFVFIKLSEWQDLESYKQGTEEYPDRFPTLIIESEGLQEKGDIELRGPGIKGLRSVGITGIHQQHIDLLKNNQQRFPMGYDFIFTHADQLMALPRSTQLTQSNVVESSINKGASSCM